MYAQDSRLYDEQSLGIALPSVGSAISTIGGIFGGSKDDGRLKANATAYNAAITGQPYTADGYPDAMSFLLGKSPVKYGGGGGWATTVAQEDAWKKYNAAKQVLAGQGGGVYAPSPSGTGGSGVPVGGPVVAGLSTGPLLIAGVAAVALVMLARRR